MEELTDSLKIYPHYNKVLQQYSATVLTNNHTMCGMGNMLFTCTTTGVSLYIYIDTIYKWTPEDIYVCVCVDMKRKKY